MAIDRLFAKRAVSIFLQSAGDGTLSPRHVTAVIRNEKCDVTEIEPLIDHEDEWIRRCAIKVVGKRGDVRLLIERTLIEKDKTVLLELLEQVITERDSLESLVGLLDSSDEAIRNDTIEMFKRANRADCLFPLVFSKDDELVTRIKGYIEAHDHES